MARSRKNTRRTAHLNPRGVLLVRAGGFGFVQTGEGEFFVPASAMGGAFDGDLVEIAPISTKREAKVHARGRKGGARGVARGDVAGDVDGRDKPAARVLRVIDRAHDTVVGRYEVAEPFGVVVPEDTRITYDIFTMRADYPDIPDGALARVRIAQFPTRHTAATGVIEEVIGTSADAAVGVDVIVARHKLETEFSRGALDEAASATLDAAGALVDGYHDLRERFVFTIDPADAKDFDDALSLDLVEGASGTKPLWRLGVHIADVSHYVPWNSSLDMDARRRATSVYLVDRVIPMLPHELSDDLCSLRPGCDRRAMTVDLYLDDDARLVRYEIYPALICSNARLSYDEALDIIEGGTACESPSDLVWRLRECSRLATCRSQARTRAGGIDFAIPEAKVRLDETGAPLEIVLRTKNAATQLVEEAMILANETVAEHLEARKWPCAYRIHERPASDALGGLTPIFREFDWFCGDMPARLVAGDPHVIQEILAASSGRSEAEMVSSLLLRSMKRALYRPENAGHFGLASGAYCHFTSPIRRYPDLVVHRMLRASLTRRPEKFDQEVNALPWICEHASDMERIAETASRESQELKMIEYLRAHVGTSFSAVISGVANWGLYVRLDCTAEGLLPLRALGEEYFSFDPVRYMLIGSDSGKVYRLGQRVAVVLKVAEPASGKLEFALAGPQY